MTAKNAGGYCCIDFDELQQKEKSKGIRYKSFSDQAARHEADQELKKKQAQEQERNREQCEQMINTDKSRSQMTLPENQGGLYWQPNIHYIPASVKFGDTGEVIVTGPAPPNSKVIQFGPGGPM
eukprot:TRINITY_DN7086_c0_g1_i1.p1 TRINITY_DN7086_c0_g1~~TRINITY_DN7086_c0_g1_i1.p1  ORF type:complete len:124 (-),score=34.81 TRINITY_DN7086_c0_g1_i1:84-455(-)